MARSRPRSAQYVNIQCEFCGYLKQYDTTLKPDQLMLANGNLIDTLLLMFDKEHESTCSPTKEL